MSSKKLPLILAEEMLAETRIFRVQAQKLRFSNGTEVNYERLVSNGLGAVLIIPLLEDGNMVLIREYSAGVARYELGFPKGKIDAGEVWEEASVRESREEIGLRPNKIELLDTLTTSASYMGGFTRIVLAQDLVPDVSDDGDEPEPLEQILWPLDKWQDLLLEPEFTEGRSYAALFLALKALGKI